VQRSWCIARATKAAHLTLSLLPEEERERLLDEWVDSGSGAQSFFGVEADAFLEFIGGRLSDRPHELTVSQFERATLRASNGADAFVAPDPVGLQTPNCYLRRGRYATVVRFDSDPNSVQNHEPLSELFAARLILMFSPGMAELWREPSPAELDVWDALDAPTRVSSLLDHGHPLETLQTLLIEGAIEYADVE